MPMAEKDTKRKNNPLLIVIIVLLIAVIALLAMFLLRKQPETSAPLVNETNLGYAEGTVYTDQEALQRAVDEMFEKAENDPGIVMSYNDVAYSEDGRNVTCSIYNAAENSFDVFISIFADDDEETPIFQSGLIRPGTGLDTLTLDRTLSSGEHSASLVYTRVYNEDGNQTIDGSVSVSLTIQVA